MTSLRVVCVAVLAIFLSLSAAAQCPASFMAPPRYHHGDLLELDDFNRDGELDTVTSLRETNAVAVNLGHRGVFRRGTVTPLPDAVRGSATGDFNRDAKLDLMIGGENGNAIYFLAGRGDGTFDAPRAVTTAVDPFALHGDDVDGDGKLDLIVANAFGDVEVRWGRGDGTFEQTPLVFTPAFFPIYLETADMNEDGRTDIITGHESGAITITLMNANRTNGTTFRADMSGFVYGLKVRDLDGDGHLDLVAADPIEFAVGYFRGKGDGTLHERIDIPAGLFTEGIDFGDFNSDGRTDIVVGQSIEERLAILYGQADGTFSEPVEHLAGFNVYGVRVADLDHDGDDDIVASNIAGYAVLFQQFGAGEFPQAPSVSVGGALGPYDVIAADLDGDGVPDVVTANGLHNTLSVLRGRPDGTLADAQLHRTGDGPYRVIAVDVNGDRHLDLVSADIFDHGISVLINRGDGTLHEAVRYEFEDAPSALSHGDVDRDGDADLVVSSTDGGMLMVFLNAGNGTLTRWIDVEGRAPGQTVLADLNGDGRLDLAIADRVEPVEGVNGFLTIRYGNGDGTFGAAIDYPVGHRPIDLAAHDFDRDGRLDFAVANYDFGTITILLAGSDGQFRTVAELQNHGATPHLTLADFNLDGNADIAAANSGIVIVHEGRGTGEFKAPLSFRAGITPFSIAAVDLTRDGRPDLITANLSSHDVSILRNSTACRQRAVRR